MSDPRVTATDHALDCDSHYNDFQGVPVDSGDPCNCYKLLEREAERIAKEFPPQLFTEAEAINLINRYERNSITARMVPVGVASFYVEQGRIVWTVVS